MPRGRPPEPQESAQLPRHPHYVGDLEFAFPAAAAARATRDHELILFVLDARHAQWSHNLMLNLNEHGLGGRALGIATSQEACLKLLLRLAPGSITCGHSTYLRRQSGNATLINALDKWKIREWHVYHLWWQRWRYLNWAVRLGYNALSLDTDISLRANPYVLLHGPLAHRNLIVGLDSEVGGYERPGLFPMINVGLVYCQRCSSDGAAQAVLSEVTRRVQAFLYGPLLWKTRSKRTFIAERVLWEQDLFKDALLHVAFGIPPNRSHHARANANPPPEGFPHDPLAKTRGWRSEMLLLAGQTRSPQPLQWLPLLDSRGGREWRNGSESVAGLPLWIFSPWNVPPHGSACAGQWAVRPSPVMIGHLVGCTSKHLIMRQLGWWHYEVSAADLAAAASPLVAHPARLRSEYRAAEVPTTLAQGDAGASSRPWRAFPSDTRVLVLRAHALHMAGPPDVYGVWDAIRRFCMLALALGRNVRGAVEPVLVACATADALAVRFVPFYLQVVQCYP